MNTIKHHLTQEELLHICKKHDYLKDCSSSSMSKLIYYVSLDRCTLHEIVLLIWVLSPNKEVSTILSELSTYLF